jgi:hypothetical protein
MLESILFSTITGVFIMLSFIYGIKIGQKINKDEKIVKGPIESFKEHREVKQFEKNLEKENTLNEINEYNIDNYDGTGLGQKELPKD